MPVALTLQGTVIRPRLGIRRTPLVIPFAVNQSLALSRHVRPPSRPAAAPDQERSRVVVMTRTFPHAERGASQGAGEGDRGPEQRGAEANRCQRRPESTATRERKRAGARRGCRRPTSGGQPAHTARQGGRRGVRDAGLSPPRSSPGWGPVARRPRLRSALARDTHQKPRRASRYGIDMGPMTQRGQ